MPVTKTAKRALRSSTQKRSVNNRIISQLEIAIRTARKSMTQTAVRQATSLADRASKKHLIHKNKAARIKSQLSCVVSAKPSSKKSA